MKVKGLILFFVILLLPFDSFAQTQLDSLMGTTWQFEKPFVKIVTFGTELTDYLGKSSIRCEDQAGRVSYVYYGQHSYGWPPGYIMTFYQTSSDIDYVFNINPDGITGSGHLQSCDTTTHMCWAGDLGNVVMLSQADSGSAKATLFDNRFFDPIINKQVFYELTSNDFNYSGNIYSNQLGEIYIEELNASVYKLKLKVEGYADKIINDISIVNGKTANLGNIFFVSAGSVIINAQPDAMNAVAPWTLTDSYNNSQSGIGDQTLSNTPIGDYMITWEDVPGWIKPSPVTETKALTSGGTITFSGTYVQQTIPIIQVTSLSLNFNYVPVGSTKDLFLTVKNMGGGTLTGNATTEAPFSIVSGASYSLGPDQSQVITVRYQPTSQGPHTGTVVFTGGDGATVSVTGKTEKPLGLPWLLLLLGN